MVSPTSAFPIEATLFELGLNSEDPHQLANFYTDALGYRFCPREDALLGNAVGRRLCIHRGAARTLRYAAYAVTKDDHVQALRERLSHAEISFENISFEPFDAPAVSFLDPDGNRFIFGSVSRPVPDAVSPLSPVGRAARLQHVVFASKNIIQLTDFFTSVIGFTLSDRVVDNHGELRTVFLRCSHEHHSLAVFSATENRVDHHCYEAGDWGLIKDWADHFAKLCLPLKWGPGRHGPGDNLFIFVHDTDQNWVEISAELEQVSESRPVGEWPHEERTLNTWGMGLLRS